MSEQAQGTSQISEKEANEQVTKTHNAIKIALDEINNFDKMIDGVCQRLEEFVDKSSTEFGKLSGHVQSLNASHQENKKVVKKMEQQLRCLEDIDIAAFQLLDRLRAIRDIIEDCWGDAEEATRILREKLPTDISELLKDILELLNRPRHSFGLDLTKTEK